MQNLVVVSHIVCAHQVYKILGTMGHRPLGWVWLTPRNTLLPGYPTYFAIAYHLIAVKRCERQYGSQKQLGTLGPAPWNGAVMGWNGEGAWLTC